MYNPVKDGIGKTVKSVVYSESSPPFKLNDVVQCFWELKTETTLPEDFVYHVLPDACINVLFNQLDTRIASITSVQTTPISLNLGKFFHYVGIQLLPGVWRGCPTEIASGFVDKPYFGDLKLAETSYELAGLSFLTQKVILCRLVETFIDERLVVPNKVTNEILKNISNIRSVADMSMFAKLSARQLQRTLKLTVGLSPHDFLKVIRVQQSFKQNYLDHFADQSHYIHSFRKITGHTPSIYTKKFDV